MAGLQYNQAVAGQQGNTPNQQAVIDQAATQPAPTFNSLNSTNLQPTTQVTLPPPASPNTAHADALVAGGQQTAKTVDDYVSQLTPTQGPAATAQQTLLNSIASLTSQDTGKDQALLDAQNTSGATQDQADLTALNNQLKNKAAQYDQFQNALGGNNGSVETSAVLAAQNAGLTKARAADIGITTAQIQAKQGDLTLAMNTAQQAVNAKYATIEDNIKTNQAQLAAIQPMLNEEQKTQAIAQQQVLKDQADAVAAQKATETQINTIALNAAQAGANPSVLAAISQSKDVLSAINTAAPALGAKVANDLKQQAFSNALALRTAANDATRVAIEQQNANLALLKFQQDQKTASNAVSNAVVTTPSGKKYIDGTGLDAAGKAAALNAGQVVLSGDSAKSMTAINNVQGALGSLLAAFQSSGVDLTKPTTDPYFGASNQGATIGAFRIWSAGNATPAVDAFGTNLKSMITDLQKLPGTGALVNTLQANVLTGKDSATTMQTKVTNIAKALEDSQNGLLVDNSQPAQMILNGKTLNLQADGTYQ